MNSKYILGITAGLVILLLQSCEMNPKISYVQGAAKEKIQIPSTRDFYTLVGMDEIKYKVKVDTFSNDSIDFMYIASEKGVPHNPSPGELLLKRKPISKIRIAKSTLLESGWGKGSKNNTEGKIIIPAFSSGAPLSVYDISRFSSVEDFPIRVKDPETEIELKKLVDYFTQPKSMEESLARLDSASIDHLNSLLEIAQSDDALEIKRFILDSEVPEASYEIILYAKYVFLKSYNGKLPRSKDKLFQQFIQLYRLISPGLLSMDFVGKEVKFKNSALTGSHTSLAFISAESNILGEKQFSFQKNTTHIKLPIEFRVNFSLEDNEWKLNLPSTYSYLHRQLRRISHNPKQNHDKQTGMKGETSYRELIRNEILSTHPDVEIDQQLIY